MFLWKLYAGASAAGLIASLERRIAKDSKIEVNDVTPCPHEFGQKAHGRKMNS